MKNVQFPEIQDRSPQGSSSIFLLESIFPSCNTPIVSTWCEVSLLLMMIIWIGYPQHAS